MARTGYLARPVCGPVEMSRCWTIGAYDFGPYLGRLGSSENAALLVAKVWTVCVCAAKL